MHETLERGGSSYEISVRAAGCLQHVGTRLGHGKRAVPLKHRIADVMRA